ncbi:MinD/ParA/CobQ/CobA-like protein [Anatilimnocola aggregata]|uniref:MinD/ParA/CobQ/CobA-like protein n=1 Tax=Anatilimnocola aggregata TaxID=2528021 RepID=A0A517YDF5_9BACT|nr:MinD/ParA family protein [Anatilimnocola aggregata]QDU28267.1 MinD/ParA/CobQ/CobA-like protein [Anatilimnocola aggregata]
MPKIISTHSFRGGTGKSNTTANLAALTAKAGYRVGIIDTDIQSPGIHVLFQMADGEIKFSLNDYLWGKCAIEDAAYDVTERGLGGGKGGERTKLFLIPSSLKTGEIARILREGYDVALLNDGLQDLLKRLQLDFLFIDTHPGVNEETLLSIAVSDLLLLIVRPDQQDFQGTAVAVELARKLEVPRMVMIVNKVAPGTDFVQLRRDVEELFGTEVGAVLPLSTEMVRNASSGLFCYRYPAHPLTQELVAVVEKIIVS